jgi:hypothetical protein
MHESPCRGIRDTRRTASEQVRVERACFWVRGENRPVRPCCCSGIVFTISTTGNTPVTSVCPGSSYTVNVNFGSGEHSLDHSAAAACVTRGSLACTGAGNYYEWLLTADGATSLTVQGYTPTRCPSAWFLA